MNGNSAPAGVRSGVDDWVERGVFIVGCGYLGARLAKAWLARGVAVAALARSDRSVNRLTALGVHPVPGDLADIWSLRRLNLDGRLVYYLAPPPRSGRNDPWSRNFVNSIRILHPPEKVILMSTTGVYGDHQGRWVDETSTLKPSVDRARRRVDAERVAMVWGAAHGVPVVVLRAAGIYGPGRLPFDRLRAGTPVVREPECPYTNRVHVDDLVQTCIAAAERGRGGEVYNVSDGVPGTLTQYFNAVADVFGLPSPPVITMQEAQKRLTTAMLSYLGESRRLCNDKIVEQLGVCLEYPDLYSGLRAIRAAGDDGRRSTP